MKNLLTPASSVLVFLLVVVVSSNIYGQQAQVGKNPYPDTLVVAYNAVIPFIDVDQDQPIGPNVWLWEQIASDLNLHYRYQQLPLNQILSGLTDNSVDLCISPLSITPKRARNIYFSAPYYVAHAKILKREESTWTQARSFLASFFSLNFYRALGALVFVIFVFGTLLWWFERKENSEEFGGGIRGLWEGFWWSAVTMTTVGYGDRSPKTAGGRIVALVWMFTAIIIISGFTASIASSLTLTSIDSSGSTISDYKDKPLGTIAHSATEQWLADHFYSQRKGYPDVPSLFSALDQGEIAAIAYDFPLLQSVLKDKKEQGYVMLPEPFNPQYYALGMRNSLAPELKRAINLELLQLSNTREWEVWLSEHGI